MYSANEGTTEIDIGAMTFPDSPDSDGDGLADSVEDGLDTDPDEYVITLESGWNLISLCRVLQDNAPQAIFGDKIVMPVWKWQDGQYQEASKIKPLQGYWIYSEAEETIDIDSMLT